MKIFKINGRNFECYKSPELIVTDVSISSVTEVHSDGPADYVPFPSSWNTAAYAPTRISSTTSFNQKIWLKSKASGAESSIALDFQDPFARRGHSLRLYTLSRPGASSAYPVMVVNESTMQSVTYSAEMLNDYLNLYSERSLIKFFGFLLVTAPAVIFFFIGLAFAFMQGDWWMGLLGVLALVFANYAESFVKSNQRSAEKELYEQCKGFLRESVAARG